MSILWTPSAIKPAAWFDAAEAETLAISDGGIAQWADKSGTGHHVSQSDPNARPFRVLGELSGHPVIRFAGDTLYRPGGLLGATEYTVLTLSRLNVTEFWRGSVVGEWNTGGQPGSNKWVLAHCGAVGAYPYCAVEAGSTTYQIVSQQQYKNQWKLLGTQFSSGLLQMYVDAASAGVASVTGTMNTVAGRTFRMAGIDASPSYNSQIDVAEVVIVDRGLSTEDRRRIEGYLAHKWGVQSLLPDLHPYKQTPPFVATAEMSGRVVTAAGAAADLVVIHDAATWAVVSEAVPDATGAWSAQMKGGEYMVTYCKAGCAPITHGPYTITV